MRLTVFVEVQEVQARWVPLGTSGVLCSSTMHLGLTAFRFYFWCYVLAVSQIAGGDHHVRVHAHAMVARCHLDTLSLVQARLIL